MTGRPQIAIVIWSGVLGGAETWSAALAQELRASGVDATIVSVTDSAPIGTRLSEMGVPMIDLGLARGSLLLADARRYAKTVHNVGADGVILMTSGYMATALRVGGYRGLVVGVEHGHVLHASKSGARRWLERMDLRLGARSISVQVAVSGFMLSRLKALPHHPDAIVIANGVNLQEFAPRRPVFAGEHTPVVAWAGRMVPGKGVDDLLRAIRLVSHHEAVAVVLAGDGPDRSRLEALTADLAMSERVRFMGRCHDMSGFWNDCDLAVASSDAFIESFGLAPLEASACGRPVVATRNGGYVDIVEDGRTGRLVQPGDSEGIAAAITGYLTSPQVAQQDGARARARAEGHFDIRTCAKAYMELFGLAHQPSPSTGPCWV